MAVVLEFFEVNHRRFLAIIADFDKTKRHGPFISPKIDRKTRIRGGGGIYTAPIEMLVLLEPLLIPISVEHNDDVCVSCFTVIAIQLEFSCCDSY